MKISQTMLKTVKLVVVANNIEEKARVDAERQRRAKAAFCKHDVSPLVAQHRKLQKQLDAVYAKQRAVANKLSSFGFCTDGSIQDEHKAGISRVETNYLNEHVVLARLVKATKEEGANILADLGIKL